MNYTNGTFSALTPARIAKTAVVKRILTLLTVAALVTTQSAYSALPSALRVLNSDDTVNENGFRFFDIQPGQSKEGFLVYSHDANDPITQDHPPADSFTLNNLTPGTVYKITIEKIDGSIGSGFTINDRISNRFTTLSTTYEQTFTATSSTQGPVEIFLLSNITNFLVQVSTIGYRITVNPASGAPQFISPPNFELTDGTPFKSPNNPTVWVLENGVKRGFPSQYHFDSWFFGRRDAVVLVSDYVVRNYPTGAVMPFKDGTLLKYSDRPGDKTIFLIHRGVRRAFQSLSTFLGAGYSLQNVKAVPGNILDSVQRGVDFVPNIVATAIFEPNYAGFVDSANCDAVTGWLADKNNPNLAVDVEIFDGPTSLGRTQANLPRPDVGAYLKDLGFHGFSFPLPARVKDGQPHSIHAKAVVSNFNLIGTKTVTCGAPAPAPPKYLGYLDAAGCDTISGWAADQYNLNTSVLVTVYADGNPIGTVLANGSRPDVGKVLNDNGLHGFTVTTPASLKDGAPHVISVKTADSIYQLLSPKSLTCNQPAPVQPVYQGYHDVNSCDQIYGWAWDKTKPSATIPVDIYDGGNLIASVSANEYRSDLAQAGIGNGYHAFNFPTPAGLKDGKSHTITIKFGGTTMNLSGTGKTFSSTCGAPAPPSYEGYEDFVDCNYIAGWVRDVSNPNSRLGVSAYDENGTLIATGTANQFRQDLVNAGKGDGKYGFFIPTPAGIKDGRSHGVSVKVSGTTFGLGNGPKTFNSTCSVTPTPTPTPTPTATAPNAAFTISGGGRSGVNGQTLSFLVPVGGSVPFNFTSNSSAGTGSITGYEWRISTTFVSGSQSFNFTLGHGSHLIELKVTNSAGRTSTTSATIIINEAPRVDALSPSSPTHQGGDQNVAVSGINFQPNLTVTVNYPGGSSTLSGAQIVNLTPTSFTMKITLGLVGSYSIRVNNPDGSQSNVYGFSVR